MIRVQLTEDRRRALRDAAALIVGQAEGLRSSGSQNTVAAMQTYAASLESLAAAEGTASLTPEVKTHLEKAEYILEGVRDGLYNADFEDRASKVEGTIRGLDEIITEFNTKA